MLVSVVLLVLLFFFRQKTAYEMRISDWSSDVCSSDLARGGAIACARAFEEQPPDEIALGDDRIERARDMRERMIERNEVRMDALEQSGAVRLGDAHQPDAKIGRAHV